MTFSPFSPFMEHPLINFMRYLAHATISISRLDAIEKGAIGFFKGAGKLLNKYGLIGDVVLLSSISYK